MSNYSDQEIEEYKRKNFKNNTKLNEQLLENCRNVGQEDFNCQLFSFNKKNFMKSFFYERGKEMAFELDFYKMKNLIIRANQLFNCSAKVHKTTTDSNQIYLENCFDEFEVLESIYGNNDFGICYTFFDTNQRYFLKNDDYIQFEFKYEEYVDFLSNPFFVYDHKLFKINNYPDNFSILYFMVNQASKSYELSKHNSIKISRQGLEGELKFTRSSVTLLTTPYMERCETYGKNISKYKMI
jgi:hypothetical protein